MNYQQSDITEQYLNKCFDDFNGIDPRGLIACIPFFNRENFIKLWKTLCAPLRTSRRLQNDKSL
jgi:hypothetical protein